MSALKANPAERWLPVPGYEGRYEVSDLGNVFSVPRKRTRGGILSPADRAGYLSVNLGRVCLVHRLVLLAHVGPCPEGREAAHGNGDRYDNRLANLRWATKLENAADRKQHDALRRLVLPARALLKGQGK